MDLLMKVVCPCLHECMPHLQASISPEKRSCLRIEAPSKQPACLSELDLRHFTYNNSERCSSFINSLSCSTNFCDANRVAAVDERRAELASAVACKAISGSNIDLMTASDDTDSKVIESIGRASYKAQQ